LLVLGSAFGPLQGHFISLGLSLNRKRTLGAWPYLRAAFGPQSKGVGQWQLKHAMQGEFAAKKVL
jgi:hypothetical protein